MPLATAAWIVAIEKYEGAELDVKSPVAGWALDLAQVLLDRGVTRIVLSASIGANPSYTARLAALEAAGVTRTGATQADLQNALVLLRGAGALLIYWVGHGIMAPERQLLCADSRKTSELRTLDADSLLTHLRSPVYPRLQIGFFECCAQIVAGSPAVLALGGDGKSPTRQFFYYAASATEAATADTTRPGFSSTAIGALRDAPEFPPESPAFFARLISDLRALPLATRPFLLQWTEESGDRWSRDSSTPFESVVDDASVAELSPSQFGHLWRQASKADAGALDLARAVRDRMLGAFIAELRVSKPDIPAPELLARAAQQLALQTEFEPLCIRLRLFWGDWLSLYDQISDETSMAKPSLFTDLPDLLLCAIDQSRSENGLRSFTKLLELAARRAAKQNAPAADNLSTALARHAQLGPIHAALIAELPKIKARLYLLLGVDWDPNLKIASLAAAWLYRGSAASFEQRDLPASGSLAQRVDHVVQNVFDRFPDAELIVEFLAPNELLSTPCELLELADPTLEISSWLEAEYPITVRWHDRMKGGRYRHTWNQIGREMRDRLGNAPPLLCSWPPQANPAGESHLVGLSIPGPSPSEPGRNRPSFFAELTKGFPYMCWPRNPPEDVKAFQDAADQLFGGSDRDQLPLALRKLRSDPVLRNLVLLIDDPDRNPYLTNLTETAQRNAQ